MFLPGLYSPGSEYKIEKYQKKDIIMKKKMIIIAACVLAAIVIGLVVWAALANGWFSPIPDMKSLEVSDITFDTAVVKWEPSDKDAELEISCKAKNGTPVFTGTVEDNGEFLLEGLEQGTKYSVRAVYFDDDREGEAQRVSFETEYNPAADVAISYVDYWIEGAADLRLDWWGSCEGAEAYVVYWKENVDEEWKDSLETVNAECTLRLLPGHDYNIKVVPTVEGYEGEAYLISNSIAPVYIYAEYWINDEDKCELIWDSYDDIVYTVSCEGDGVDPFEAERGAAELELTLGQTHIVTVTASKNGTELARWDGEIEMPEPTRIVSANLSVIDAWTALFHVEAEGIRKDISWEMDITNGFDYEGFVEFYAGQTENEVEIAAIPGTTLVVIFNGEEYSVDMPEAEPYSGWTFERISFYAEPDYSGWDGDDLEEQGAQNEFAVGEAIVAQMFINAGGTEPSTRFFDQTVIVQRPDGTNVVVSNYENSVDGDWEAWHTWFDSSIMGNTDQVGTYTVYVYINGLLAGTGVYTVS